MPPRKTTSRPSAPRPSRSAAAAAPTWLLSPPTLQPRIPARSAAAFSDPTTSSSAGSCSLGSMSSGGAASSSAAPSSLSGASASTGTASSSAAAPMVVAPKAQSISEHLEADPPIVPSEAFAMLLKLEKRPLPTMVSTAQTSPTTNPRCACFNVSRPAQWYAHNMCERCQLLNRVIQAAALNSSSASYSALLSLALLSTDCISETTDCYGYTLMSVFQNRPKVTRTLPVELWSRVLNYAISESITNDNKIKWDGVSRLRLLMHTSSMARLKAIELFSPLPMYEIEQVTSKTASKARVHNALTIYLLQRLQYFLIDPTLTKHSNTLKPAAPASSAAPWTSRGYVGTVTFTIIIDTVLADPGQRETYDASIRTATSQSATLRDACAALDAAFNKAGAAPRFANAFLRVKSRRLDLTDVKGSVIVILKLDHSAFKTWYFSPSSTAT